MPIMLILLPNMLNAKFQEGISCKYLKQLVAAMDYTRYLNQWDTKAEVNTLVPIWRAVKSSDFLR